VVCLPIERVPPSTHHVLGAVFGQHLSAVPWREDVPRVAAILIFAATYLFIAIGKLPGYHLDRAGAALLGASLMVGFGVLSLDDEYRAIDFETITLLLGMMIVVANLRLSGFFRLVNGWVVSRARHPLVLLAAVVLVAGSFSAFLVNDTICLVMTPLVLEIVARFKAIPSPIYWPSRWPPTSAAPQRSPAIHRI